jgi:hypothetical protein
VFILTASTELVRLQFLTYTVIMVYFTACVKYVK